VQWKRRFGEWWSGEWRDRILFTVSRSRRTSGPRERETVNNERSREPILNTGADLLVRALFDHGVRVIFGMPGSHTTAIYDAIVRHGGIRTVLARNEQAAAFMADGYARVTGWPGVVCTTAGPGATNALTGIAEAYGDSIPVLLIAGQVNRDKVGRETGSYHEIDLEGIFRPCTKYSATLRDLDCIEEPIHVAFHHMTHGRPRPAAVFLPQDWMSLSRDWPVNSYGPSRTALPEIADATLAQAGKILRSAARPIILAGGGAVWSIRKGCAFTARGIRLDAEGPLWADAASAINELAKRLDCPVITTLNGKGILDERDPYSLGHARSVRSKEALPHADAMLAVGCRFTEVMTWFWKLKVPEQLVQIDIDLGQIGVNYPVKVGIVADAREALSALLQEIPARQSAWGEIWERARNARPAHPEWLIDTVRAELPENGIVFTDASEMALRMHTDYPAFAPRTFFYASNFIALGWGYPAAVGAAVAMPDRSIVCVAGDGGFVMSCQELATAVRYQLHLIVIVHNDSAYGAIKNLQRKQHGERYIDVELNNPDFVKLADAYGLPGVRVNGQAEFASALRNALARRGPSLIEVPDEWRSLRV
jgi:acetolactate synthase-1/2/3 large subunit